MRIHYLQHVPFEGLADIEPWIHSQGHTLTSTRFYESDFQLPAFFLEVAAANSHSIAGVFPMWEGSAEQHQTHHHSKSFAGFHVAPPTVVSFARLPYDLQSL